MTGEERKAYYLTFIFGLATIALHSLILIAFF